MHAGVVAFRVRPDRMEEAVRTYLGSVVPAMREQRGFRGVLVLTDNEADEGYSISLWETEDALRASAPSNQELVAMAQHFLTSAPTQEIYEVLVQE